jgi:3-oxoacyl-[acyl-carrier-protein] synthase-3
MTARCGITGRGFALPTTQRHNDDQVFTWLRTYGSPNWEEFFYGYNTRHVLKDDEMVVDLMATAARQSMQMARLAATEVDLLLGFASVSSCIMPNELARLHQMLGLGKHCWVVPINVEFSNFNAGLIFADAVISSGRARNALIVCGGNWSQQVDYHGPPAVSAGDGAGAAVMQVTADDASFRVVDFETLTDTTNTWGHMSMTVDPIGTSPSFSTPELGGALTNPGVFTQPYFHIDAQGMEEFATFGVTGPVSVVKSLLTRNALAAGQVTIICHQPSRFLLDKWQEQIAPHKLIDTLATFANMTLASIPVNLAFAYDQIETDHLILLGIGPELHSNGLLLRRNG